MFRRRILTTVAAVSAVALLLAGCGGGGSNTTSSSEGSAPNSTLTLGLITPASTFSAQDMSFGNESPYGQAVYDTLLKADPDGKIVPSLATKWAYNDDKTVLSLTLRSDVTFSDGTNFNADTLRT